VKVLLFGGSTALSYGFAEADRLPNVLQALLKERFPALDVTVEGHSWVRLTDSGLDPVLHRIEDKRPEYLILTPSIAWIAFSVAERAFKRRTPRPLHGLLDRLLTINRSIQRRLLHSPWPWLTYTYSAPFFKLGRMLGSEPLFRSPKHWMHLSAPSTSPSGERQLRSSC
jgi:hypothetical protein